MLINDLDVRVIHATTGEIIRQLTIDPNRRYHGTGARIGGPRRPYGPRKTKPPNPDWGFGLSGMSRDITESGRGIRTRDPHLGKVMLYQLSHVRKTAPQG